MGALADRTRRAIVVLLAERPEAVGEIASALPVSRPAVSQHLKVLKDAGLVDEEPSGTRRVYRLNADGSSHCATNSTRSGTAHLSAYQDLTEQALKKKP